MKKKVADRIRLLRLSRNFSQENMAGELELSIGAYSNIERGVTDITLTRLNQIAEILEVSILDIIMPGAPNADDGMPAYVQLLGKVESLEKTMQQMQTAYREIQAELAQLRILSKNPGKQ